MDQIKAKKFSFVVFFKFVTSASTLRPPSKYIFVFRESLVFLNFFKLLPEGFGSWESAPFLRSKIISQQSHSFGVYLYQFAAVKQTSTLNLAAFLLKFEMEESVLRVNKSQIFVENAFNLDRFEIKGSHGSNKDQKIWFWVFCRFVTSASTLRPLKRYTFVFRELFGF